MAKILAIKNTEFTGSNETKSYIIDTELFVEYSNYMLKKKWNEPGNIDVNMVKKLLFKRMGGTGYLYNQIIIEIVDNSEEFYKINFRGMKPSKEKDPDVTKVWEYMKEHPFTLFNFIKQNKPYPDKTKRLFDLLYLIHFFNNHNMKQLLESDYKLSSLIWAWHQPRMTVNDGEQWQKNTIMADEALANEERSNGGPANSVNILNKKYKLPFRIIREEILKISHDNSGLKKIGKLPFTVFEHGDDNYRIENGVITSTNYNPANLDHLSSETIGITILDKKENTPPRIELTRLFGIKNDIITNKEEAALNKSYEITNDEYFKVGRKIIDMLGKSGKKMESFKDTDLKVTYSYMYIATDGAVPAAATAAATAAAPLGSSADLVADTKPKALSSKPVYSTMTKLATYINADPGSIDGKILEIRKNIAVLKEAYLLYGKLLSKIETDLQTTKKEVFQEDIKTDVIHAGNNKAKNKEYRSNLLLKDFLTKAKKTVGDILIDLNIRNKDGALNEDGETILPNISKFLQILKALDESNLSVTNLSPLIDLLSKQPVENCGDGWKNALSVITPELMDSLPEYIEALNIVIRDFDDTDTDTDHPLKKLFKRSTNSAIKLKTDISTLGATYKIPVIDFLQFHILEDRELKPYIKLEAGGALDLADQPKLQLKGKKSILEGLAADTWGKLMDNDGTQVNTSALTNETDSTTKILELLRNSIQKLDDFNAVIDVSKLAEEDIVMYNLAYSRFNALSGLAGKTTATASQDEEVEQIKNVVLYIKGTQHKYFRTNSKRTMLKSIGRVGGLSSMVDLPDRKTGIPELKPLYNVGGIYKLTPKEAIIAYTYLVSKTGKLAGLKPVNIPSQESQEYQKLIALPNMTDGTTGTLIDVIYDYLMYYLFGEINETYMTEIEKLEAGGMPAGWSALGPGGKPPLIPGDPGGESFKDWDHYRSFLPGTAYVKAFNAFKYYMENKVPWTKGSNFKDIQEFVYTYHFDSNPPTPTLQADLIKYMNSFSTKFAASKKIMYLNVPDPTMWHDQSFYQTDWTTANSAKKSAANNRIYPETYKLDTSYPIIDAKFPQKMDAQVKDMNRLKLDKELAFYQHEWLFGKCPEPEFLPRMPGRALTPRQQWLKNKISAIENSEQSMLKEGLDIIRAIIAEGALRKYFKSKGINKTSINEKLPMSDEQFTELLNIAYENPPNGQILACDYDIVKDKFTKVSLGDYKDPPKYDDITLSLDQNWVPDSGATVDKPNYSNWLNWGHWAADTIEKKSKIYNIGEFLGGKSYIKKYTRKGRKHLPKLRKHLYKVKKHTRKGRKHLHKVKKHTRKGRKHLHRVKKHTRKGRKHLHKVKKHTRKGRKHLHKVKKHSRKGRKHIVRKNKKTRRM